MRIRIWLGKPVCFCNRQMFQSKISLVQKTAMKNGNIMLRIFQILTLTLKTGINLIFENKPVPIEVFQALWNNDIIHFLIKQTNAKKMTISNNPYLKENKFYKFQDTNKDELNVFNLCLLKGQVNCQTLRNIFLFDPLYYRPVFSNAMSGRRFK